MNDLAYDFEIELTLYCEQWELHGIDASNVRRGIDEYDGAVATAEWYVTHDTPGMHAAIRSLGCEWTIEWLVARSRFRVLFTEIAVASAEGKLKDAGC